MILLIAMRRVTVLIGAALLAVTAGPTEASPGSGNIQIEINNCKKAIPGLQKAATDFSALVVNYNQNTNSDNGKKSIEVTYRLKNDQILPFMNAVALLGEIKSQSFSENRQDYDLGELQKKIESYKSQLNKVLNTSRPDPDLVQLLNQQIDNLERQMREAKIAQSGDKGQNAQIYVSLREKGYDQDDSGRARGVKPFDLILIAIAMVLAAGLIWSLLALNAIHKRAAPTPRNG